MQNDKSGAGGNACEHQAGLFIVLIDCMIDLALVP
jgi:hypothetical protein